MTTSADFKDIIPTPPTVAHFKSKPTNLQLFKPNIEPHIIGCYWHFFLDTNKQFPDKRDVRSSRVDCQKSGGAAIHYMFSRTYRIDQFTLW